MNYSEFLFVQLLMAHNESFRNMPYDLLWEKYKPIYKDFETSSYNTDEHGEYECIENFLIGEGWSNTKNSRQEEIQDAKAVLEKYGYFTRSLWTDEDVFSKFKCTTEEALNVLEKALSDELTMDQAWFAIQYQGEDEGLEPNEEA